MMPLRFLLVFFFVAFCPLPDTNSFSNSIFVAVCPLPVTVSISNSVDFSISISPLNRMSLYDSGSYIIELPKSPFIDVVESGWGVFKSGGGVDNGM